METSELSNTQLQGLAPSIFATKPWSGVSARYAFIPTIKVVDAMRDIGYVPVRATQSIARIVGKTNYTKHMVRFRHKSEAIVQPKVVGGNAHHIYKKGEQPEFVEMVLTNAHDRSSAYFLDMGLYRQLCSNGLVVCNGNFGGYHIQHSGDIVEEVLENTRAIIKQAPKVRELVVKWKGITLSDKSRRVIADASLINRYGMGEDGSILGPITAEQLLTPRRTEDEANTLWTTINVIQENMMRGEIAGASANGRKVSTRPVKSVQRELEINRGIWAIGEVMAERLEA